MDYQFNDSGYKCSGNPKKLHRPDDLCSASCKVLYVVYFAAKPFNFSQLDTKKESGVYLT